MTSAITAASVWGIPPPLAMTAAPAGHSGQADKIQRSLMSFCFMVFLLGLCRWVLVGFGLFDQFKP